jgi:hypothetical protein
MGEFYKQTRRKKLEKLFKKLGFSLVEYAKHTKAIDPKTGKWTTIPPA